ncbi:MAG: hypothetical protein WDN26_02755 [Chitinophagaceae bacterium]
MTYGSGTSRAPEAICKASLHVDLYDPDAPEAWKQGYYIAAQRQENLDEERLSTQRSGAIH